MCCCGNDSRIDVAARLSTNIDGLGHNSPSHKSERKERRSMRLNLVNARLILKLNRNFEKFTQI